jgi:glycosyltransferase involved in cell wall biosynthesis
MSPRALRVMLLTSAVHWRGSGLSYAKLARGLAERGHRVDLVVASDAVAEQYEMLDIPVHRLVVKRTGAREIMALLAIARAADSEIVIVDKPRDLRLAAWLGMLRPMRIVIRYNKMGKPGRSRFVDRWTARRASAVLYQSAYIRDKATAELPLLAQLPTFVVPNGYDAQSIAAGASPSGDWRARHGIGADEFVVLSVGFAEADKRFDRSVEAVRLAARQGVRARFVFCGDGPCRPSLEAAARRGGVRATWLGVQNPSEALTAIAAADMLLHPSAVEIFGNVLAEAMGLCTPIIATRAGGNVEMLGADGRAAILADDGCAETFAAGIAELYARPDKRRALATAARARLISQFPLSLMIDRYEEMLQSVAHAPIGVQ